MQAIDDSLDFSILPDELQHLAPLIAQFTESDDVEREKVLDEASDEDLRVIEDATRPHWAAINAFLDENMELIGPRQDLALALDAFAQAAQEARMHLEED